MLSPTPLTAYTSVLDSWWSVVAPFWVVVLWVGGVAAFLLGVSIGWAIVVLVRRRQVPDTLQPVPPPKCRGCALRSAAPYGWWCRDRVLPPGGGASSA